MPNDYVEGIQGLSTIRVPPAQASGLVQLRELLRKVGLRDQEREATYAIERNVTRHLLFTESSLMAMKARPTEFRWREPLAMAEGIFCLVAFEGTVAYGLHPGRALLILLVAIGGFALVYATALATGTGDIYCVWPEGRLEQFLGGAELASRADVESLPPGSFLPSLGHGLWFSMLSAFHLGFRELNVGNWIARLQPREYTLQAVGWVRTIAGVQSLLSVYLLAMWVLTYFGRPF